MSVYSVIDYVNKAKHGYRGPFNTFAKAWYWSHVGLCTVTIIAAFLQYPMWEALIMAGVIGIFSMTKATPYSLVLVSVVAIVYSVYERWS